MRKLVFAIGASMGALLVPEIAHAHLFTCEKTVNGTTYVEIDSYPATITYDVTVTNAAEEPSEALEVTDNVLASLGYTFEPATPFTLEIGESVTDSYEVVLENEQSCLDLDAADGSPDGRIDNMVQVTWDDGSTQCWATVICGAPPEEPPPEEPPPEEPPPEEPPEEPPGGGITRSPGFFKTHPEALSACLEDGPITLGPVTIESLEAALGLLWSSPAAYDTGEHRSRIDRTRFQLSRHALVATCNQRLFGTMTDPEDLLEQVDAALAGTDCALMHDLAGALDAFNNSAHDADFPDGFDAGPATPREASALAEDPTTASTDACDGAPEERSKRGRFGHRGKSDDKRGHDRTSRDRDDVCDRNHGDDRDDWDDHDEPCDCDDGDKDEDDWHDGDHEWNKEDDWDDDDDDDDHEWDQEDWDDEHAWTDGDQDEWTDDADQSDSDY